MNRAQTMWEQVKADTSTPTEALGAALHRDQHPTRSLDGFSCSCYDKAERLMEWLHGVGFQVVQMGGDHPLHPSKQIARDRA